MCVIGGFLVISTTANQKITPAMLQKRPGFSSQSSNHRIPLISTCGCTCCQLLCTCSQLPPQTCIYKLSPAHVLFSLFLFSSWYVHCHFSFSYFCQLVFHILLVHGLWIARQRPLYIFHHVTLSENIARADVVILCNIVLVSPLARTHSEGRQGFTFLLHYFLLGLVIQIPFISQLVWFRAWQHLFSPQVK